MDKNFKTGFFCGMVFSAGAAITGTVYLYYTQVQKEIDKRIKFVGEKVEENAHRAGETIWNAVEEAKNGSLTHDEFLEKIDEVFAFISIMLGDQ